MSEGLHWDIIIMDKVITLLFSMGWYMVNKVFYMCRRTDEKLVKGKGKLY